MTEQFTPRLGLVKPQPGTGEPADIARINLNSDNIDKWIGAILVNDGVTPATAELFDGAVVKEKSSGKVWVAEKNVGGTFDKKWIRFPYQYRAFTNFSPQPTGATFLSWGAGSYLGGINSADTDRTPGTNFWTCPQAGTYHLRFRARFEPNASGNRALVLTFNGTQFLNETETIVPNNGASFTNADVNYTYKAAAGDVIGSQVWQSSGSSILMFLSYDINLVEVQ